MFKNNEELALEIRNQLAVLFKGQSVMVLGEPELVVKFNEAGYFQYHNLKTKSLKEMVSTIVDVINGKTKRYRYVAQYYDTLRVSGKGNELMLHDFEVDAEISGASLIEHLAHILPKDAVLVSLTLATFL